MYVADGINSVAVINGSSVSNRITVGWYPTSIAVDSTTHTVYVGNQGETTVSVINGTTMTTAVDLPQTALGIAVDLATHTVYATVAGYGLSVFADLAPRITSDAPGDTVAGSAYNFRITGRGNPAPTFSISQGTLPDGLSLDGITGVLAGTSTAGGRFSFTVTADNGTDTIATADYTITVAGAPTITSGTPGSAIAGTEYSFVITATGYPTPTFAVTNGNLPNGLTLNAETGLISGTPEATGEFSFAITAGNGAEPDATSNYTITVAEAPMITSGTPGSAIAGTEYSFVITATGYPTPTFSVLDGSLPDGLTLNAETGVISGTPRTTGDFSFTVAAGNGINPTATAVYTITVAGPPTITSDAPDNTTVDSVYNFTVSATGYPAPMFSITDGNLPNGLTLNAETGLISGTPETTGDFSFTVAAGNGINPTATADYTITVAEAPMITSGTPDSAIAGTEYNFTINATGYPTPTFSVVDGNLPNGLNLNAETGLISGTPRTTGDFSFTVAAGNGINPTATADYTITVAEAPMITSGTPGSAIAGTVYNFTITATGYPTPTFSVVDGSLPNGLTLNAETGLISGTPETTGEFSFAITAGNGAEPDATANYTITVAEAPMITSGTPGSAIAGTEYSFVITATGYPTPTFSVVDGSLPNGLTLNAETGVISGTPDTPGDFAVTITASNGVEADATADYTLVVGASPVVIPEPTVPSEGASPTPVPAADTTPATITTPAAKQAVLASTGGSVIRLGVLAALVMLLGGCLLTVRRRAGRSF